MSKQTGIGVKYYGATLSVYLVSVHFANAHVSISLSENG